MILCWQYLHCNNNKCPSFGRKNPRCWLVSGTHCHDGTSGEWLEKMEVCLACEVFIKNIAQDDLKKTFKVIAEQFNNYKARVEKQQSIIERSNQMLAEERKSLQKRVEESTRSIREMQNKLLVSTKMSALGALSAGIAHSINNPLSGILISVRTLLEDDSISESRKKEYLELSLSGLLRIENTIRQVLCYSSQPKLSLEPTNIVSLAQDSVMLIRNRLEEKNINLVINASDDIPPLMANPAEIQQVFMNLVTNARDAVADGGRIDINILHKKKTIEIIVRDNGAGISKKIQNRIFDLCFSTKPMGHGVGLGLSICDTIVKRHGGKIKVKSSPGKGSIFTVTLPVQAK